MQVVLTGRCYVNGRFMERSEVCRLAGNVGIRVVATVTSHIDHLVASRTDTVKARRAMDMGVKVISYPALFDMIQRRQLQHDIDGINGMVQGRVRPITGPNGGRMVSRETLMANGTTHLEYGMIVPTKAEVRAEAKKRRLHEKHQREAKAQPKPHRMLDL